MRTLFFSQKSFDFYVLLPYLTLNFLHYYSLPCLSPLFGVGSIMRLPSLLHVPGWARASIFVLNVWLRYSFMFNF